MTAEPLLEHHEYPDHRAMIFGMISEMNREELIDKFGSHYPARLQVLEAVVRQFLQASMVSQPGPEGESEAMLLLLDNRIRQKTS